VGVHHTDEAASHRGIWSVCGAHRGKWRVGGKKLLVGRSTPTNPTHARGKNIPTALPHMWEADR
jgi:hypothetical protein